MCLRSFASLAGWGFWSTLMGTGDAPTAILGVRGPKAESPLTRFTFVFGGIHVAVDQAHLMWMNISVVEAASPSFVFLMYPLFFCGLGGVLFRWPARWVVICMVESVVRWFVRILITRPIVLYTVY